MEIQQQEEFLSCRDRAPVTQAAEGGEALPEKAVPGGPEPQGGRERCRVAAWH